MTWAVELLKKWKELATVTVAILIGLWSFVWFVVEPRAQQFVTDTVNDQIVELKKSLAALQLSLDHQVGVDAVQQATIAEQMKANDTLLKTLLQLELSRSGHQP